MDVQTKAYGGELAGLAPLLYLALRAPILTPRKYAFSVAWSSSRGEKRERRRDGAAPRNHACANAFRAASSLSNRRRPIIP